jgi:hypothetical protein
MMRGPSLATHSCSPKPRPTYEMVREQAFWPISRAIDTFATPIGLFKI